MTKPELFSQSDFAKHERINQSPERINLLIALGKIKPKIFGKKKLIEFTEENINIAKRKK